MASSSSSAAAKEQRRPVVLKTAILLHLAKCVAFELKKYCLNVGLDELHFNDLNVVYTDELLQHQSRLMGVDNARINCVSIVLAFIVLHLLQTATIPLAYLY